MRVDRSAGPARPRTTLLVAIAGASYLAFAPHGAQATVVISSGSTSNIHCASGVCTPTAANAVLNVTHLQNLLATESIKVTTGGTLAYEIVMSAKITWSSSHGLTLYAAHSVKIDEPISVKGKGALDLEAAHGAGGELSFGANGFVSFSGLTNKLTVHGDSFKLVNSVATLASAVSANPKGNFALAKSYNAAPDGTYAASPVGKTFDGIFEGLGNTISNLSINDPRLSRVSVGLFSDLDMDGTIRHLNLENATIKGAGKSTVGGIAANSYGFLKLNTVSGQITTGISGVAGGLVGYNEGPIRSSHTSATIKGGTTSEIGGLTGFNYADITSSYATGAVTGASGSDAGGLIADQNFGTISDCYAKGAVSSGANGGTAGGLIGFGGGGTLTTSYATGAVTGGSAVGGVGWL